MTDVERESSETVSGDAGDVMARTALIRHGGARSVTARGVAIEQGGAVRVKAQEVDVTQGGVVLAKANELHVTAGGVVAALSDSARLDRSWAKMIVARGSVEMNRAAALLVGSRTVRVRDSAIGLVLARDFHGEGVRVLMGTGAAVAFGAGLGLALGLLTILRRRR